MHGQCIIWNERQQDALKNTFSYAVFQQHNGKGWRTNPNPLKAEATS